MHTTQVRETFGTIIPRRRATAPTNRWKRTLERTPVVKAGDTTAAPDHDTPVEQVHVAEATIKRPRQKPDSWINVPRGVAFAVLIAIPFWVVLIYWIS